MKSPNLVLLIVACGVYCSANAQADCSLRKDSNGIKVYSCNVEGSKIKGIKAIFELEADFDQVVSVIYDVPSYTTWQYHMVSAKLVSSGNDELTYYSEISAPWPVSNRDLVVKLKFNYNANAQVLEVNGEGIPATIPLVQDIVRIPHFKAKWMITKIEAGKLRVEYTLDVDIGGSIPAWLINMAQAEGPFETFTNLKERLKLKQYEGKEYSFLKK